MNLSNNDFEKVKQKLIQMRRREYRDFSRFRRYYFPHYHKVEDAAFHKELAETLNRISDKRYSKLAIAAPRGSAKSTIITLEYVIYSICHRREKCVVIISSTFERSAEALQSIKYELEYNRRLLRDFPEVCELDQKPEPQRWSRREIITKNDVMVTVSSVGQNIRGKRFKQYRPSLVILDDIEGNEMVQNEDSRYKIKDWFEKSVLKVGDNETNFIFAGTIHHYGSLLAQYTNPKQMPGWESRIYRSVIQWSEGIKEWEEWGRIFRGMQEFEVKSGPEAARAYFESNREKMLAGTEVLWPQSKDYYKLMEMREEDGELSFDSEMQNEPINPRDCFFNVDDIQHWDERYSDEIHLLANMESPRFFMACDPSLGKDKTRGDFSAIITCVKDAAQKIVYVLDVDMERRQPENLLNTIIGYIRSREIEKLAVESNQFQALLIKEIEDRVNKEGLGVNIEPIENRTQKIIRIQSLQPFIKTGKIQLHSRHRALIEQLKYFPKGQHDDGPDALEMLYQIASQDNIWDFI